MVLERVPMNSSAYGARNGQKVGEATGEVLLDPGMVPGSVAVYNRGNGK
jgi:hypothetical protein